MGKSKKICSLISALIFALAIVPQYDVSANASVNYKKLYGEYLKKHPIEEGWNSVDDMVEEWTGAFIYIDNNDVPELIVNGSSFGASCNLYTVKAGKVKKLNTEDGWAGGLTYVKRGSRYYTGGGRTGDYWETWFSLKKGKTKVTGRSTHNYIEDNAYTWNGNKVSKSTYKSKVKKIKARKKYVSPAFKKFTSLGLVKYMR